MSLTKGVESPRSEAVMEQSRKSKSESYVTIRFATYFTDSYVFTTFEPGSFWAKRRDVVRIRTLPYQLEMLRKTGRYDAFDLKKHHTYDDPPTVWPVPNHLFWDSDVAKWIEGVSYFQKEEQAEEDKGVVEDLVNKIRNAQQADGYLNIHFTVVTPKSRWTNLRDLHELYNAGHLIEGALAHSHRFESDDFLEPVSKYAQYIYETFGNGKDQKHGYPGHPEIELSLIRLYKRTQKEEYLHLARYFIEERGKPDGQEGKHYYEWESIQRGEDNRTMPAYYPAPRSYWYQQAHKPILEQDTIEGHSVRAMYLLTAVADLALIDKEGFAEQYIPALQRLWDNMVNKKMYLTGGIGAMKQWEGFGIDYFLPQSTDEGGCYSETCAAIGVMMLAERLLQLELNREFADILERCLYNVMLTGMSTDGKAFTYVNQMASSDGDLSKREEWFECACCPPNIARVLGHIGGYLWTANSTAGNVDVNVHLYANATLTYPTDDGEIVLKQRTNWPWDGNVEFELETKSTSNITVRLRIPSWADDYEISPSPSSLSIEKGYLFLPAPFLKDYSKFRFSVPLRSRLLRPHPYTNQPIVALARGPIVYCIEDADHPWVNDHFKSLCLPLNFSNEAEKEFLHSLVEEHKTDLPTGEDYIGIIAQKAGKFLNLGKVTEKTESAEGLDFPAWRNFVDEKREAVDLHFIPYFARANRGGNGMMRVGIRAI